MYQRQNHNDVSTSKSQRCINVKIATIYQRQNHNDVSTSKSQRMSPPRVREVPGSIPSQGPRHSIDVIKMVPVVPLFSTEHSKGKILALSQELRVEC